MKQRRTITIITFCAVVLSVSGCSLAPEYKRPGFSAPSSWPEGNAYKEQNPADQEKLPVNLTWKAFYLNEKLQQVLELALKNNKDLRIAALNIQKTRALYRIQKADHLPSVNVQASGISQKIPESLSSTGESYIARQYDLNLGVAYELDFFGRIKSLKASALEQFLATKQARNSIQITLLSEVTRAWLALAADKERLELAGDTFNARQSSYKIIQQRLEAGASSELSLRQSERRLEAARFDMARYTGEVARDINALRLIVGSAIPETLLPKTLAEIDADDKTIGRPYAGISSSILLQRPDILAAERELKALNAKIGAARAAFFPRITLTGTFGVASNDLETLFDQGTVWSFMPKLTLPIFTAGKNKANLKASRIDRDIAVARYEKTIQTAFREVADALAQNGTINEQLKAQAAFLKATESSYILSDLRFKKGIDGYLNVLDAQRSLYSAKQTMIDVRLLKLDNRVTLYKAMGGGGIEYR